MIQTGPRQETPFWEAALGVKLNYAESYELVFLIVILAMLGCC